MPVNTLRVTADPLRPGGASPVTGFAYLDAVLDQPGSVIAMAHRGGALHPEIPGVENTRHAFAHAVALGYRYLETDVHATSDGVLLAFHDKALDRVTDTRGVLSRLTSDEVKVARIAGEHPVPTMAELLEEFPDCRFNIDVKSPSAVPAAGRPARPHRESRPGLHRLVLPATARRLPAGHPRAGGHLGRSHRGGAVHGAAVRACGQVAEPRSGRGAAGAAPARVGSRSSRGRSYAARTRPAPTCTSGPSTSPKRWTSCSTWVSTA